VARHLNTLVMMVCGILGSRRVHLPAIANHAPASGQSESQVMRFRRWLKNESIQGEVYFLPFVEHVLASLCHQTLTLVIDGSAVGQGCVCLMVRVIYKKRALPLMWVVHKGKKGHFEERLPIELIQAVHELIPPGSDVVCLGDGEFDGTQWLKTLDQFGWHYACRTAKTAKFYEDGEEFSIRDITPAQGECSAVAQVQFTQKAYGPVLAVAWWERHYEEPIYRVSNFSLPEEACFSYRKRFRIETFFSDQKSRGFNLHKSRLNQPQRVSRLMIASCLAYLWIIYLGACVLHTPWQKQIHRADRCDLSLFQLGLRYLDYLLRDGVTLPKVDFAMPQLM